MYQIIEFAEYSSVQSIFIVICTIYLYCVLYNLSLLLSGNKYFTKLLAGPSHGQTYPQLPWQLLQQYLHPSYPVQSKP